MPYFLFLFLCLLFGSNFILMKKALLAFSPLGVAAVRVGGGAAVLAAAWILRPRGWPLRRGHVAPMALVVVLGYVWPFALQPYLIPRLGGGFVGMMVGFVPLCTILASIPILGVYPTPRQVIGVVGGLACLGLILVDGMVRDVGVVDCLLAVSVPVAYAICNTYIKLRLADVPPLALSFSTLAATALILAPAAVLVPGPTITSGEDLPLALSAAAVLGILGTGLGAVIFTQLLQDHGPLFAGMVTYPVPAIAVAWGWLDSESITVTQIAALGGVLAMVAVVQYRSASPHVADVPPP